MKPGLRAVAEGALTMVGTLLLLMLGVVMAGLLPADTVLSEGFFWTATMVGALVLMLGGAAAAGLAVRRLDASGPVRYGVPLIGPAAVVALVAVPAWAGGEHAAGLLYLGSTLLGALAGIPLAPRIAAARGR
ncbi:hypothetical protein [Spirillospora albida]|uniref:hypothetical protein n=1 Tax=Spirillospora albida TaxID=58123 RepID=UPI0004C23763|nr:hypothetical protein [Spirillospora albida]